MLGLRSASDSGDVDPSRFVAAEAQDAAGEDTRDLHADDTPHPRPPPVLDPKIKRCGGKEIATAGWLLLATACAEDIAFIPYPDVPAGLQSRILIPRSGKNFFAMREAEKIELPTAEGETDLLLLAYAAPLEALGLTAGPQPTEALCRNCALLAPDTVVFREVDHDWTNLDGVVPSWGRSALMSDHADRCSGCPAFLSDRIPLPGLTALSFLEVTPWDDDSVMVRDLSTFDFYRVSATGEVSVPCLTQADLDVRTAFRGEGSDMWLMDHTGVVRRMDLDALDPTQPCASATSTFTPSLGAIARALHVSYDSDPVTIHALVAASARIGGPAFLHRFHGGAWSLVHTFAETGGVGSIARDSEGSLYAVAGRNELATVRGEVVTTWMPTDLSVPYEFTVVAHISSLGMLTATKLRGLLRPTEDVEWSTVDDRNLPSLGSERFGSLLPYGDGVLLGNYQGGVHFYSPSIGYCDQVGLFGRSNGRTLTRLPDGTMFSAESELYRGWRRPDDCVR